MSVTPTESNPRVRELVRRLDDSMTPPDDAGRCRAVKRVLEESFAAGTDFLDPKFLVPNPERYARRLVHRDPQDRYTVLAMVWNGGQGTPLHDHAGIWCVECVYKGEIKVTSYNCFGGDPEHDIVQFKQETVIQAGVGKAGALIPPFEYHVLENAAATSAVTLHVYGGEMTHCHIFEPVEKGWLRKYRELSYTA
jgi:predicted metal-dependent enzyme (double-stranded beta helix superfamily)